MMNMNLVDAVKNLINNGGSIKFGSMVYLSGDWKDYDVNAQLVQGNKLLISVDFEDGTNATNSCPVINNDDDAINEIYDYLVNELDIYDFDIDDFDDVEYNSAI